MHPLDRFVETGSQSIRGNTLVRDRVTGAICVKKVLDFYDPYVYGYLIDHHDPHIPQMYDFWEEEDKLVIIEAYIKGRTLEEYLTQEGPDRDEKMRITGEILDGIEFLHNAPVPIIHRDLKTDNIMIDSAGNVKIIDYDAAKTYKPGESKDTVLIGTMGSAAPEQYGFAQSDPRTDIFAIGVMLRRIFNTDTSVEKVVFKATRMDPDQRYQNINELRKALFSSGKKTGIVWKRAVIAATGIAAVLLVFWGIRMTNKVSNIRAEGHVIYGADGETVATGTEAAEDAAETAAAGIPAAVPAPKDLGETVPEDVPEDVPVDVPEDIPEDVPEDPSADPGAPDKKHHGNKKDHEESPASRRAAAGTNAAARTTAAPRTAVSHATARPTNIPTSKPTATAPSTNKPTSEIAPPTNKPTSKPTPKPAMESKFTFDQIVAEVKGTNEASSYTYSRKYLINDIISRIPVSEDDCSRAVDKCKIDFCDQAMRAHSKWRSSNDPSTPNEVIKYMKGRLFTNSETEYSFGSGANYNYWLGKATDKLEKLIKNVTYAKLSGYSGALKDQGYTTKLINAAMKEKKSDFDKLIGEGKITDDT